MHIGYAKFTMNLEIDFTRGKIGNIEGRATLFKSIIDAGWKLTLYSQVKPEEERMVTGHDNIKNKYGIDNSWIKSIRYKPISLVDQDTDLLIIENGPDNLLFKTRHNHQPFIRRCADILNSYSGLVFIFNIHPNVPFPLAKMAYCKIGYDNKNNCYRKESGSDPEHGWASYDEVLKNKKLIFFNQAYNNEKYLDHFDRKRQGYRLHSAKTYRLPILYGEWLIPKYLKNPKKHTKQYDLVYMGYPRYREKEFEYFFLKASKLLNLRAYTWGPWYKKSNLKFTKEVVDSGINVMGFLEAQVMCVEKYSNSIVTLGLISKKLQECGWVTHRTLESIHSGCILLGLKNAEGITDYLDDEFLVENSKEFSYIVEEVCNISKQKRLQIVEQQQHKIIKYDGKNMLKYLMKIYRKEKL